MESLGQELSNHNSHLTFLAFSPTTTHGWASWKKKKKRAKNILCCVPRLNFKSLTYITARQDKKNNKWLRRLYRRSEGVSAALILVGTQRW